MLFWAVATLRATFGAALPVVVGGAAFTEPDTAPPCDLPDGVLQHGVDDYLAYITKG